MTCNCQNWDDPKPCPKHGLNKGHQPAVVNHQMIVVKVYRRYKNKKWFYTITRDALLEFTSQDFDTKKEAMVI